VWKSRSENILVNQVFDYFSSRALIIFPRARFDNFSSRACAREPLIKIPSPRFDYFSLRSVGEKAKAVTGKGRNLTKRYGARSRRASTPRPRGGRTSLSIRSLASL
jgi:hypothetical protein